MDSRFCLLNLNRYNFLSRRREIEIVFLLFRLRFCSVVHFVCKGGNVATYPLVNSVLTWSVHLSDNVTKENDTSLGVRIVGHFMYVGVIEENVFTAFPCVRRTIYGDARILSTFQSQMITESPLEGSAVGRYFCTGTQHRKHGKLYFRQLVDQGTRIRA